MISFNSSNIIAGDTVTLTCSITLPTGTPDFQWEGPGGVSLTSADSNINGQRISSVLTLNVIATSQAGQYTCTATLGGSVSTSVSLNVQSEFNLFFVVCLIYM